MPSQRMDILEVTDMFETEELYLDDADVACEEIHGMYVVPPDDGGGLH